MNDLELRRALIDALRRPWPCDGCPIFEDGVGGDFLSAPDERLARAIEDGDVEVRVKEGAWL